MANIVKNPDGTYSYDGATYRKTADGQFQRKIAGQWTSNYLDPNVISMIRQSDGSQTTQRQVISPIDTRRMSDPNTTYGTLVGQVNPYEQYANGLNRNALQYATRRRQVESGQEAPTLTTQQERDEWGTNNAGNFTYQGVDYIREYSPSFVNQDGTHGNFQISRKNADGTFSGVNAQENPELYRLYGFGTPLKYGQQQVQQTTDDGKTPNNYQGLFSGNLRTLTSRRNWVGENAEYLKSKGWSDADIEGYKGLNLTNQQRAQLNVRLQKDLGGYEAWQQSKQASQPVQPSGRVITPNQQEVEQRYQQNTPITDQELLDMNPGQAIHLQEPDYRKYLALQFGRRQAMPSQKMGGRVNYGSVYR